MHLIFPQRIQMCQISFMGKKLSFFLFLLLSFQGISQNALNLLGITSANPASVAFSVRKLSSAYTGPVMRVRRASDNAIGDVAFDTNNEFSSTSVVTITTAASGYSVGATVALSTFSAATDVYVQIWYDQSGNANNMVQNTDANQPKIIIGGAIQTENGKPFIRFYGSAPGAYNSLNLTSALTTNTQVIVVNKFQSGGSGFLLGNTSQYYWHAEPANNQLIHPTAVSSISVRNAKVS